MGRIGIYGGTFNPPHTGHVAAAEFARRQLALDKLLVIPSCISPHKQLPEGSADPRQRLEMVQLAFSGIGEASDIELQRGSTSYTYETVQQLRSAYPEDELILFMGTDMFLSFDRWKHPERILQNAALGVFYRGDPNERELITEKKAFFEARGAKVHVLENPITDISSTDLRRMLVFGCAQPFLCPAVGEYIQDLGLYGTDRQYRELSIEELEAVVLSLLDPRRVQHVLGCRKTAQELANLYGADEEDAGRAALLHDVTKALSGDLQLTLCREYGISLNEFSTRNPKTLHALTGALVAQRIFGEKPSVVAAIGSHTTGKANMNTLEKIIYVADYVEPNRDFPGVEELRKLAYTDLDGAMEMGLCMTLQMLNEQGRQIAPESEQALADLRKKSGKKE